MQQENAPGSNMDGHGTHFIHTPIETEDGRARTELALDARHQGWLELPHGGLLMSMLVELAHRGFAPPAFAPESLPLRAGFRLGGPSLSLNDTVEIAAHRQEGSIRGELRKIGEEKPSLTADFGPLPGNERDGTIDLDRIARAMETVGRDTKDRAVPLPYSRNCFVCGAHREKPGLERRFHCIEAGDTKIAFTFMGLDPDDQDRLFRFRLPDGQAHPGCLAAVLDETLGWGGFLHTLQGGVTVRLEIDILRAVDPGEKLLCFGVCTGVRGKDAGRQFWYSEGGILPMGEEDLAPIMLARGQWLAVPKLTEEMKEHLIPSDWSNRWFGTQGETSA